MGARQNMLGNGRQGVKGVLEFSPGKREGNKRELTLLMGHLPLEAITSGLASLKVGAAQKICQVQTLVQNGPALGLDWPKLSE